ncbi:hypothetical protein [Neobacillus ginsengisoli]|uniref:DUF11 domain-containing protein n=1 Tax=Neobacillus ginsengisoli TaxID=904295 RepID=A0ABT9XXR5_9BACI|nr:hypothetical protein [Neobacillus ginsengisoli]MDQ0200188.1 hypothetical protein [Neobacillus ginsengisoli]
MLSTRLNNRACNYNIYLSWYYRRFRNSQIPFTIVDIKKDVDYLTNGFTDKDVIDIVTSVNGVPNCRIHFELTTKCTTAAGLTTITYTITNFLDSNSTIYDLIVEDQIFPFDGGIHPGSIGRAKFTRNGTCVPIVGTVFVEFGSQEFEFGSLCTAMLKGPCNNTGS